MFKPKYNDINLVYDEKIYDKLRSSGIDDQLAKHVSHLFIRDPLVIFRELLDQDDTISSDHFEVNFRQIAIEVSVQDVERFHAHRISNLQTGKPCDSSHRHQTLVSVGVWNSEVWRFKSQTLKTLLLQSS
jgi:hypothetical protein